MILINIDGVNCVGKSTLIENLIKHYSEKGLRIGTKHFPRYHESPIGEIILSALKKEIDINPSSFQMLCSSDRLEFTIKEYPTLHEQFDLYIVDRYSSSAVVYGSMEGVEIEEILYTSRNLAKPDLQIILFLDTATAVKRLENRGEQLRKYDNAESIEKASKLYFELDKHMDNIVYVDASKTKEQVLVDAINHIDALL
jgi:thymidylate kinase